jgi:macrodomain Ter protein organizer (MatP/YcbG family)
MARPRKTFNLDEAREACRYIYRKLQVDDYWPTDDPFMRDEAMEQLRLVRRMPKPDTVQKWVDTWLDDEQRNRLLLAMRVRRSRKQRPRRRTINISSRASDVLHLLADREGMTISDFIVYRLGDECRLLDDKT